MHRRLSLLPLTLLLSACDPPAAAVPVDAAPNAPLDEAPSDSRPGAPSECAPVAALSCGSVISADTANANDGSTSVLGSYAGVVGNYSAPEIVYAFVPEHSGTVEFDLVQANALLVDLDLFLIEDQDGVCSPGATVARGFHGLTYEAVAGQPVYLSVDGYAGDAGAFDLAVYCEEPTEPAPVLPPEPTGCGAFESTAQENAPLQLAGHGLPPGTSTHHWTLPTTSTNWVDFAGTAGSHATHEGIDWIHDDAATPIVDVVAAAPGQVVYVRLGCEESTRLGHNESMRECGGGWGNHVVLHHGDGVYTRYAHLDHADVNVLAGDVVSGGQRIGGMGNSGRSETRHLHFELGMKADGFDPCAPAQSFDAVHPPGLLGLQP